MIARTATALVLVLAGVAAACVPASGAESKSRSCPAITVHLPAATGEYTFRVRVLKGRVTCPTARRALKRYMRSLLQPHGWLCFSGHGQDNWAATCITGSERDPRKEIRAY